VQHGAAPCIFGDESVEFVFSLTWNFEDLPLSVCEVWFSRLSSFKTSWETLISIEYSLSIHDLLALSSPTISEPSRWFSTHLYIIDGKKDDSLALHHHTTLNWHTSRTILLFCLIFAKMSSLKPSKNLASHLFAISPKSTYSSWIHLCIHCDKIVRQVFCYIFCQVWMKNWFEQVASKTFRKTFIQSRGSWENEHL